MRTLSRLLRLIAILFALGLFLGVAGVLVAYWMVAPRLPDISSLREVRLQQPLRVLTADGRLMGLFGEMRRTPVPIAAIPEHVKQAFIAVEDARFYEHPGIDFKGISRAVWLLLTTDMPRVPGGSTITQQVARQFFLSPEYSFTRKLTEIFLALRIERTLAKDEILELYLNKTFFGNRAYGVVAAADFYYGKPLAELSIAEAAMLAAIPKFPSTGNPIANRERALVRRNYVLDRMAEVGYIDAKTLAAAKAEPDRAHPHEPAIEVEAPWAAEMARLAAVEILGEEAVQGGYVLRTTIDGRLQAAANDAIRAALIAYDRRHGYRGPEARFEAAVLQDPHERLRRLRQLRTIAGLVPALVLEAEAEGALLELADGQQLWLPFARMAWARPFLDVDRRGPSPKQASEVVAAGDVVRILRTGEGEWELAQLPAAQGALAAIEEGDGAIRALVGGFSFAQSKFNRAVQSQRQPGSSFKPIVYAAAFERGFGPASIVLDAPIVHHEAGMETVWRPQNDNQVFNGPMRLREAMVSSRNLVSVRLLDAIGVEYARSYASRFGLAPETLPNNLTLALGSTAASPLAMARAYAAFSNGGFLVEPYLIERLDDAEGRTVVAAQPRRACRECDPRGEAGGSVAPRIIEERTAFMIHSLLLDVVKRGTGRAARVLGREDVGGKTGTTNDYRDAWFTGFGGGLVVSTWVGRDDFTSLGRREFGSRAALPAWIEFMKVALEGRPERSPPIPPGLASAPIDPDTGRLVPAQRPGALTEWFPIETLDRLRALDGIPSDTTDSVPTPDEIF
jgi:penicillin-binding protein 1A